MKSFIPLIRSEWRLLLFGFAMTFASSLGQTYFIALFSGEIRVDLSLSHGEFGAVYSAATLLSAVILLWSGSLIDKMDLRRFSYMLVAGLAAGCLLLAVSQNIWMLFISILLLRHLGQGLMSMTSATAMVRYLDHQKGKANALSGIGYSVSEALLPGLVVGLMFWLSWRESWVFWTVVMAIIMPVLIHRLLRNHEQRHQVYLQGFEAEHNENAPTDQAGVIDPSDQSPVVRRKQWTRAEVIRDPQFYLFLPALMTLPLLFTGFMFHQVHLVEEKGWSLAVWGGLYILYALTTTVTKLVTGVLIDRFGAMVLVALLSLPLSVGLFILASSDQLLVAVLFMFFLGVSAGIYSTLAAPFFSEKYGNKHLGSIKSLSTSVMVFASAISPVIMGWLIDGGVTMDSMALGGVVYTVIASGLAWYAYRQYKMAPEL
ncbi:MAG: MFS transporter [uncultured Thiotrichaceae bacterium]|uniref:MFS transporter n=1 Tax=uncultured Thiotrichaceae bacterium TaxID=298394 RepID=A0A6S6U215_9GAMM|nr:MAG: MFS transporter [uncultured Thiotrichaceae bacterium]